MHVCLAFCLFEVTKAFTGQDIYRPRYLSAKVFTGQNVSSSEYLPVKIFTGHDIIRLRYLPNRRYFPIHNNHTKYWPTQTFTESKVFYDKIILARMITHSGLYRTRCLLDMIISQHIHRPRFLPAKIFCVQDTYRANLFVRILFIRQLFH